MLIVLCAAIYFYVYNRVLCSVLVQVDIPYKTFNTYARPNKAERAKLGASVGKKPVIDTDVRQFIADVTWRQDRANEGLTRSQVVDMAQDFYPTMTRVSLSQAAKRTIQAHEEYKITSRFYFKH